MNQKMPQIIESDNISGIQRLIGRLSAAEGISIYELAERSGLHPTTLYSILKKEPSATRRPVRRETIRALAEGNRYGVTFDAVKKRVIFERSEEPAPKNDVEELLDGMRRILARAGKGKLTAEEREKILAVVRVLVA
jgi:transcriptional regulator with XRE-family HTH domain